MAGQVWAVAEDGGYMGSPLLSKYLRTQSQPLSRFRSLCDVKDASLGGLNKGDRFHWNIYSNVATEGGPLAENAPMPETKFTVDKGTVIMSEYGNGVPYTGKLDNLSVHSVKEVITKVLKNDCASVLDKVAYDQFADTPLVVAPVAGTSTDEVALSTTGATLIENDIAMGIDHVSAIVLLMKERNIPGFINGEYVCVARPGTFRNIRNELRDVHQYTGEGLSMILRGEIGKFEGVRFVEQTNIASKAWTNGKSDEAFFLGEDTVAEAVALPEEIRGKLTTDYGRAKGIAWYALLGYGLTQFKPEDARIVKWGSAA